MKTIGIITYHHYYNYGTMLQALALQEKVEQLGYQAELILNKIILYQDMKCLN